MTVARRSDERSDPWLPGVRHAPPRRRPLRVVSFRSAGAGVPDVSRERPGGADADVRHDGDHGGDLQRLPRLDQIDGSVGARVSPAVPGAADLSVRREDVSRVKDEAA